MNKILILTMSCNIPYYQGLLGTVKDTWAKPLIQNKYKNVTWFGYTSCDRHHPKPMIDFEEHMIYVDCPDDLEYTYEKTQKAYNMIKDIVDFNYVVRTNASVFVNIKNLIKRIESVDNDTIIGRFERSDITIVETNESIHTYWLMHGFFFCMNRNFFEISMSVDDIFLKRIFRGYESKNYDDNIISIKLCDVLGMDFKSTNIENDNDDLITSYKSLNYCDEKAEEYLDYFQLENTTNPETINDRVMIRLRLYTFDEKRYNSGYEYMYFYELNDVLK